MKVTFRQRILILRVAAAQKGDLRDRELWDDVQDKVALTDCEKEEVFKPIPNSDQVLVDLALFDAEPGVEIPLEKQERRYLVDALPSFKGYEQGEPKFVRKLLAALENSLTNQKE